jgi:hypothetical protein
MTTFTEPAPSTDILVRLSKAFEAMHHEIHAHMDAVDKATADIWQKHAPFIAESESVFLQVKAEAYRAGFTDDEIEKVFPECSR